MRAVVLFFPLQITFLEFFEVLLGCAEVTCEQVSETVKEDHRVFGSNTETRKDSPEVEVSEEMIQTKNSPFQLVRSCLNAFIISVAANLVMSCHM